MSPVTTVDVWISSLGPVFLLLKTFRLFSSFKLWTYIMKVVIETHRWQWIVLSCVFTFWVPCCDVRYDFRIQKMFGSSLPPLFVGGTHVLRTDHLTCRGGGYGILIRSEIFFRTPRELEYLFFLSRKARFFFFQNSTLGYMTKTLNQIIFFPPSKSEYFFQQRWESEYFFRKQP